MNNTFKHIASFFLLSGLFLALSSPVFAQTPGGTQIDNISSATFRYLDGSRDSVKSNLTSIVVELWGALSLNKTASRVSAGSRDTVQFKIVASYTGNLGASNVIVTDTVPSIFKVLSASRGTVNGNIVSWNAGRITSSAPDSITITAVVKDTLSGTYSVTNHATATDSIGTVLRSSAGVLVSVIQSESCRLTINSSKDKLVANGQQWAVIRANITDTLGVPKPNGTPVFFKADIGTFSNGKDTVTKYSFNGLAIDSLNANITSSQYVQSKVTVTLISLCNVSDTIGVEFYPGAITGTVMDNVTRHLYKDAFVRLIDSVQGNIVDSYTTKEDGKFFMFVPKTATYRVDVSAADKFEFDNTVTTYVNVDIKGTVTNIIPNKNSISGAVYYWISNNPIYIPNMPIELTYVSGGDSKATEGRKVGPETADVIKSVTDARGVYKFEDIRPGKYKVVLGASELNGSANIIIPEQGYYILNGNIPVLLNNNPTIEKSGTPAAVIGDTVEYQITVRNPNKFAVTNTRVKDSLHADMQFISASNNGTYNALQHAINWNLGSIDSSFKNILKVKVRVNSAAPAGQLVNTAILTASEILPLTDTAATLVNSIRSLTVLKTVNRDSAAIGDTMQYRIVVKNTGNTTLLNVSMADTIDAQKFTVLLVSSNATLQNDIVTMTQNSLLPGDSIVVSIRVQVKETSTAGFVNRAYAQSGSTPPENSVVVTPWNATIAPNTAVLLINKYVSRDTVVNGDTIKYIIRFRNAGTKNLTNVVVTDTLPKQVTKNTVLYQKGTIDNNILTYFAGSMPVGAVDSVVIVSVVNGSPYIPERVTNTAYVRANEYPLQKSEASFTSLIGKLDKLLLHKTVSSPTVFTGDSLGYVVRVTNVSNRTLTNVIVRDPVPFQLENISVVDPNTSLRNRAKISIVPVRESGVSVKDSLMLDGSVVIYKKDTIDVGEVDSFYVKTTVRLDRPNFELILNTAYATTNETPQIIAQAVTLVEPRISQNFQMQLTKHVSKDTVHIGDTMSYVIRLKNITDGPLTKITVVDTLPRQLINPRVTGNAKLNGNVVSYELGYLGAGQMDSIIIIAQLDPYGIHDGELVLNYAFARALQIDEQTAFALFTAKTDPACRIEVTATPDKIIGNGRSKAFIKVNLTNTLGYPKPDGTPVVLTTTVGEFSNGQSMRVLYSKDGIVTDSLRATVAGSNLVNAMAIASADDGQGCKAKDTINIVFFPGAIEGTVIDHRTQMPVLGALVRAYSKTTDSLVGTKITEADGYYLFPVAKTDSFRVLITTRNEFNHESTVRTSVVVNVSGGGDAPTSNQNSVSGAVYYLVSHEPVAAANIGVRLQVFNDSPKNTKFRSGSSMTTIDSVYTDSTGTFQFDQIPAGRFMLTLIHPSVQGGVEFTNSGSGTYVINANIAVTLNPNIIFDKSGPSRVALTDTASYSINVQNTGTLSTTNTVLIDSLHWSMQFISATGGGVYQPAAHRILWNIGKLDSASARLYEVKVRFLDTLINSVDAVNRAIITSNQTTAIRDSVPTLAFLAPTMKMWKTSHIHQAAIGDTVFYSIKMKNLSGSFGDSISITDNLPKQVQYLGSSVQVFRASPVSVLNDTVGYNSAAHSIFWKLDTLFVGDSATITLVTRVRNDLEPGDHTYTNIAGLRWKGGSLSSDQDSLSNATVRSFISYLKVTKQAIRKIVEIGDVATYVIRVTNMSPSSYARNIRVMDKIPFGFKYINGSSFMDSTRLADPTGRNELTWQLNDSLAAGKSIQFVYRLIVGAGAADGNGINTAQASGVSQYGALMVSAEVQERVEVRRGVFTTHGLIIGKVFYDDNRNRYQDTNEVGVKNIELMMEDGTRILTGDDGKYSVPDVLPGEHVIRVRTHTLPKDASLEMGYNDFARDSTSRFVNLTESGIARVDFYLMRNISRPDSLVLNQSIAKIGDFSIQRIASPRNIVFIEDKRFASMKLTGLNFEVGKAVLKPESFVVIKQLADILREYPDQPLIISGHTDSMKIATAEFPNNKILSMARAMAVKNYLVEKQGVNVDRIRIEGHGETRPLATNKSIDGRSLNRRVEFFFTPSTEEKPINEMPVAIEIPIEYTGTENITKVDFRDILDPSFSYVEGSALFADSAVKPVINGNELHWTLTNLGTNFKYKLRYTVMVQRPVQYEATAVNSNSSSICYFVGDSVLKCIDTLTTTNEIAIAVKGRAVNFVMSGVLFDVGKSTLRSAALTSLETTAKFLKEDPTASALIEGHTDSSPIRTKEFPSNTELSFARANTIKQKLVSSFGIAPERLKTIGYGEYRPLASNMTKEGKQVNRRIEMRILRSEFAQKVLPEGGIDSSRLVVETLLPKNAPAEMDSMMRDKSKERYILKLDVQRKVKRNTIFTTIHDTVPAGLNLVPSSIMKIRGVDSVHVNGNILTIHCSSKDSSIQLYYIAEVSDEGKEEATVMHDYTVRKKQSDGSIAEERIAPTVIEIRKKRMMVRQQR